MFSIFIVNIHSGEQAFNKPVFIKPIATLYGGTDKLFQLMDYRR